MFEATASYGKDAGADALVIRTRASRALPVTHRDCSHRARQLEEAFALLAESESTARALKA